MFSRKTDARANQTLNNICRIRHVHASVAAEKRISTRRKEEEEEKRGGGQEQRTGSERRPRGGGIIIVIALLLALSPLLLVLLVVVPSARSVSATDCWSNICIHLSTTMASRALTPLLRRSIVSARTSSKALKGGGSPPLPAFARIPAPSEPLVENHDCLFDDACAPELALDFDAQNVSTWEGIGTWMLFVVGGFGGLFTTIKYLEDPPSNNPAASREVDVVVPLPHHD